MSTTVVSLRLTDSELERVDAWAKESSRPRAVFLREKLLGVRPEDEMSQGRSVHERLDNAGRVISELRRRVDALEAREGSDLEERMRSIENGLRASGLLND